MWSAISNQTLQFQQIFKKMLKYSYVQSLDVPSETSKSKSTEKELVWLSLVFTANVHMAYAKLPIFPISDELQKFERKNCKQI